MDITSIEFDHGRKPVTASKFGYKAKSAFYFKTAEIELVEGCDVTLRNVTASFICNEDLIESDDRIAVEVCTVTAQIGDIQVDVTGIIGSSLIEKIEGAVADYVEAHPQNLAEAG